MGWRQSVLPGLLIAAIAAALIAPPVPQDASYHHFAARRELMDVPNFWNVVSNIPFAFAGIFGIWAWRRSRWGEPGDRWPWLIVALAGILICFGSGYYHWSPDNRTLYWDRLPMTLAFMGIVSASIAERIHARRGLQLLAPLLVLGVLSVESWFRGEMAGRGDLRFYALVQFYPMLALPLMLTLFPARYTHTAAMWWMIALYALAKLLELGDRQIFEVLGGSISGHSLKHIAGAFALAAVFAMLARRKPVSLHLRHDD